MPPQTQAAADELLASHLANFFKTSLVIHNSLFVITQFYIIYLAEEWQHETQCTRFNKICVHKNWPEFHQDIYDISDTSLPCLP